LLTSVSFQFTLQARGDLQCLSLSDYLLLLFFSSVDDDSMVKLLCSYFSVFKRR